MREPQPTLFIDRDGTLIEEPEDRQVDSFEKFRLKRGAVAALHRLRDAGHVFVMVTNQDGLGTAEFPEERFRGPQDLLLQILESQDIEFDEVLVCPHYEKDACACRKPGTALVKRYMARHPIDAARSFVIGDRESDMMLAERLGLRGICFSATDQGGWPAVADQILARKARRARVERKTRETRIVVSVDLDSEGTHKISTGIGFFDHMLEQVARHGGFVLQIHCDGDLRVDEHHTVEDCALALGDAIRQALGDKRGIGRYGYVLPMDEAEARVALDLSGRPYAKFEGRFGRDRIGDLPTELVPHFFRSFGDALGAAIHVEVNGDNSHHMVEACFKCVGRALRQAIRVEGAELPSSKGRL